MENEIQPNIPPAQPLPYSPPVASQSINWPKILLITVLGLVVVIGSLLTGIQIGRSQISTQQPITEQPTNIPTQTVVNPTATPTNTTQDIKFTGNITETNNECWSDGICSIKIDGKWVVTEIGGLRPPDSKPEIRGNLIGINFSQDTNKYIGKMAEVYAKQTDGNNFTIYGNESYYIKLLE